MNEIINTETGEYIEIIVENEKGELVISKEACEFITSIERQMKDIKKQYNKYREALKGAMEEHNIKKIDTEDFVASYKAPTERVSLDSKKVEALYPKVYTECMTVSDVKASVNVRLR